MTPQPFRRTRILVAALAVLFVSAGAAKSEPQRRALLVGCTEYKNNSRIRSLTGPANDVKAWAKILCGKFQFPDKNITRLVGWPEKASERPTKANIVAAYKDLIARAGQGDQIFIMMSGHGVQIPQPENTPSPEPDGMDEVFLPADAESWSEGGIKNVLLDDEIGGWLDQLRAKGADVWVVFDCCHSGTITRGAGDEVARSADATDELGVPPEAIEASKKRSAGMPQAPAQAPLNVADRKDGQGRLVAFYAAQPFEEAPELPRPLGSPRKDDNVFGMMSHSLIQSLEKCKGPVSYRTLFQMTVATYRAERTSSPPTPLAEGDLGYEVFGTKSWPKAELPLLTRLENELRVGAGTLRGITPGSVIQVLPPTGEAGDPDKPVGFVKVREVTPGQAIVDPCDESGKVLPDDKKLPDRGRCRIDALDMGDMRIRVWLTGSPAVRAAFESLKKGVKALVNVVPEDKADWVVREMTPAEALREFGLKFDGPRVVLLHNDKRKVDAQERARVQKVIKLLGSEDVRKIYGVYAPVNAEVVAAELERDLPKIFKGQNLWHVSGSMDASEENEEEELVFEVQKLPNKKAKTGEVLRGTSVTPGDILQARIENKGLEDLWVTVLYFDANFGVQKYYSGGIKAGKSQRVPFEITDSAYGTEGLVVLTLPQRGNPDEPDYSFLEQEPLGVVEAMKRGPGDIRRDTPFDQLLGAAAFNEGGTRAGKMLSTSNPEVRTASWVTLRKPTMP